MEENLRFKIDGASLTVRSKFTGFVACERETFRETFLNGDERRETSAVRRLPFLLFYFVFEGNFPSTSPRELMFGGAI